MIYYIDLSSSLLIRSCTESAGKICTQIIRNTEIPIKNHDIIDKISNMHVTSQNLIYLILLTKMLKFLIVCKHRFRSFTSLWHGLCVMTFYTGNSYKAVVRMTKHCYNARNSKKKKYNENYLL